MLRAAFVESCWPTMVLTSDPYESSGRPRRRSAGPSGPMRRTSPSITRSPHPERCAIPGSAAGPMGLAAEEKLGGGAHHLRVPHRVEGELGVDRLHALYRERLRLDLLLDHVPHRAHRAREAERDVDVAALVVDADVVDQAELHEVHPDLRVYDVPELIPYALFGYHSLTPCKVSAAPLIVKPPSPFSTPSSTRQTSRSPPRGNRSSLSSCYT